MVLSVGNPSLNMEHNNTTCNASCFCEELSRFKDFAKLSGCFSPLVFVFQLLIGVNPTTVFPGFYSQPWMIHILSRFVMQNFHFRLAFIEHSCSSWLYRDSQHVSAPKRMENMREYRKKADKIKCIWQLYMYPGVCSLPLNQREIIPIPKKWY